MKVIRISASNAKYGGNVYEKMIDSALSGENSVETFHCMPDVSGYLKYLMVPIFYLRVFFKSLFNRADIVIQPLESVFWLNKRKKNIVLLHHFDPSYSNSLSRLNQAFTFWLLKINMNKVDKLVVVSNYWKREMEKVGFKDVTIAYNAFEIDKFKEKKLSDSIFDELKNNGKLNIYIGNAHPKKGYFKVVDAIGDLSVNLISSGYQNSAPDTDRVTNYTLNYDSYLEMLKSVDLVITYSQFKEGWCRTAHEALLLGTPVVGSGFGGMGELLEFSGQDICASDSELRKVTQQFIKDRSSMKAIDQSYVESFSIERFNLTWQKIIKEVS
ncbi:glycosyltransferase [Pseudoalteromonas luteoviolacea]|uniref:Glycosyltransferase subfamily 4-like N-terminal domain-containing protein n=1 Tax=Pseudoalteromonas luteoviolacea S4054 TaxID=1129367 RepID=A0A0F6ACT1_9GAMM|nr:glycosyltransferase [Pseudoalteromonas luteoviolacea]AOT09717.1 hypothetical protein S4054249_18645 [Pseudoalteromonas luteoviolacea]AOT14630.1 hypothetical protein S40542_18615 [Pseudoalteromonas luteoviolacea]AOT19544.1 hypothetical protein S4054_18620 [Pseudoalteromonas luteoviolacea]KKE83985.1 hypothetical protein N479_11270 [Pseudoalteromonas luteoviolacea S4054]KZN77379.1 hypothetical protein N481_04810 [Pseudoalteromonas luteoviolacea S4047-1]